MTDILQVTEAPLSFTETMGYLKVSRPTLTKLLSEKKIRGYNLTHKIVFYKNELEEDIKKLKYTNRMMTKHK